MLSRLRTILEMIRFSHTLFALPFALLAAVMAWTASARSDPPVPFRWQDLLGIVLCMVTARSAAMAFNRLADRRLDADNPRTGEAAPSGRRTVRVKRRARLRSPASLAFVASTLLFLPNRLPLYLSLPVLAFLLGYSYTKRFTAAAHFWLGAALMLAPISAWIAIRGQQVMANPLDLLPASVLGGAVLLWVAGFDIIYACQDVEFDRADRTAQRARATGRRRRFAAGGRLPPRHGAAAWPRCRGFIPPLGWIYGAGVAAVAVLLVYEHSLVRPDDLTRVNVAFFHVNAVVSIGLLAVTSLDLLTSASVLR